MTDKTAQKNTQTSQSPVQNDEFELSPSFQTTSSQPPLREVSTPQDTLPSLNSHSRAGCGHFFTQKREEIKIPLDKIARELRIQVRYLKAIEEDQIDQFPERVFALGFIRSYAQYLGLEGEKMVEHYRPLLVSNPMPEIKPSRPDSRGELFNKMPPQWFVILGGAIVVCLGIWMWFHFSGEGNELELQADESEEVATANSIMDDSGVVEAPEEAVVGDVPVSSLKP